MQDIIVAPSILSADFSNVTGALNDIVVSGAQWVHLDVMDGNFVPNITFGAKFIHDIRKHTDLLFDTHLMIEHPEHYIQDFANAGSQVITVHSEACVHLDSVLRKIKQCGCRAGVAICPSTPLSDIRNTLDLVDIVLVMSVNPGFGGQEFIPYTLEKIKKLVKIRESRNFLISVDGGINENTAKQVLSAGTDVVVTGSAFFNSNNKKEYVKLFSK